MTLSVSVNPKKIRSTCSKQESSLNKYAIVPPKHTSGECFDTPEDLPKLPFGTGIACAPPTDLRTANATCVAAGRSLCSVAELADGRCCGLPCDYDGLRVWTRDGTAAEHAIWEGLKQQRAMCLAK